MKIVPKQKPGKSIQTYQTPPEFITAALAKLHLAFFDLDVAASAENTVAKTFYDEAQDGLKQTWCGPHGGWTWCNPPYSAITPWVKKAVEEAELGNYIAVLVPASVGANWWRDYVHDKAHVLFLNDRIQFVGADWVYPKDLALLLYTPFIKGGYEIWSWKA